MEQGSRAGISGELTQFPNLAIQFISSLRIFAMLRYGKKGKRIHFDAGGFTFFPIAFWRGEMAKKCEDSVPLSLLEVIVGSL